MLQSERSRAMRKRKKTGGGLFGWFMLLLFVAAIFFTYDQMNRPSADEDTDIVQLANAKAPTSLNKTVEAKTNKLISRAADIGIVLFITDGFRDSEQQEQLYAQGRTAPGSVVTQARGGESYHNYGLAVDFALKNKAGQAIWDMTYDGNGNGKADWMEVVDLAKDLGFDWGGDWPGFKDYPHLQMDFGLSISDLQNGYRPEGSQ